MKNKTYTSEDLINIASNKTKLTLSEKNHIIENITTNPILQILSNNSPSAFFIIDLNKMNYLFMSESIKNLSGYSAKMWIKGGVDFSFNLYHPDDKYSSKLVHEEILKHSLSVPIEKRTKYNYTHCFRFKKKDGSYISVLRQSVFIELGQNGKPLLILCQITDITQYKKDKVITLTISEFDELNGKNKTIKKDFYPEITDEIISPREIEVLKLISDGHNNYQISKILEISEHTVKDHRRNMLKKCKANNITELYKISVEKELL